MILQQVLGAALLVAAGFEPIDRAHGAKPSTSATIKAEPGEPGFWHRIKGRLFNHKSEDKTAQSASRSGQHGSTARDSAKPQGNEKIVHSRVSLRQFLASRLNRKQDSKNPVSNKSDDTLAQPDRRPIPDRLRSRLARNREKPAETVSERKFASVAKTKVESRNDSDPKTLPNLQPVPAPGVITLSTSEFASGVRKNYPDREINLLTRADSNPRWTAPPSLLPVPGNDATGNTTEMLTSLALADTVLILTPASRQHAKQNNYRVATDLGDTSNGSHRSFAGPATAAAPAALDRKSEAPGIVDSKDMEPAGLALIDPNAARSAVNAIAAPSTGPQLQAIPAPAKSLESVTDAVQPEAATTHAGPATVEPATLEFGDPKAPVTITQTGFVHHSTPVVAFDSSNTRNALNEAASSGSGTPRQNVLSGILAPALYERLGNLPIEYYPIGGLLLGSMLVLLLSRGGRATAHDPLPSLANVAAHPPATFNWPLSIDLPSASDARGIEPAQQPRGGLVGPLTTTIGLAIIAVGAMAVLRAQVSQQPALMRPGVVIAAIGQFVLLLGIVTLTAHRRRLAIVRKSAALGLAHAESVASRPGVAGTMPFMPFHSNYAWPTATPANAGQSNQSGQIAQLKAQLACVSQQLDHLGVGERTGPAKSA